jgi:hypothetical protein
MTDTTAAGADLGAAQPAAPAPAPAMSYVEAEARKAEILNNPEARDKLLQGDVELTQTWRRIQEGLAYKPPPPTDPANVEQMIDHLRSRADISEEVANQIRQGRPVTAYERSLAEQRKQQCFRDKEWVRRYLDGGRSESTELALLTVVLAAPIRG